MEKHSDEKLKISLIGGDSYTEVELAEAFAKSLKDIRKYKNISLKELSEKIGIPCSSLSSYENATRIPSFVQALKISAFFGLTLEQFIAHG